jgi:hypothetical protein
MQNPDTFTYVIRPIFHQIVEFLIVMQSHFIQMQINSTCEIRWGEEQLRRLVQSIEQCITFCVLVSAIFGGESRQIAEKNWPTSARQVIVQFLLHWANLPPTFERLSAYAVHALVPIVRVGPVFTTGFSFEMEMFDMMLDCQLRGYAVLHFLLAFHVDVLLDVYEKNAFNRPRRESWIFMEAIGCAMGGCTEPASIQAHIGYLLLIALLSASERFQLAKSILTKIAELFSDVAQADLVAVAGPIRTTPHSATDDHASELRESLISQFILFRRSDPRPTFVETSRARQTASVAAQHFAFGPRVCGCGSCE